MAGAAVSAVGLDVGYAGRPVVSGIDLDLAAGRWLSLVGTNGSGKSTLLRTVVGLLPPVGGVVEVHGAPPATATAHLGYLGQFHPSAFVLPLRAREVVRMGRFGARGLLGRMRRTDHDLVEASLARMGATDLADAPLRSLSGGQQQRVYLAQVLARRADVLVLDEPTAGLDAAGRELYLRAMAEERGRGATLVVATHDIDEALQTDASVLLAGRVVAQGAPAEVLTAANLLETFGVAIRATGDALVLTEHDHSHSERSGSGPAHEHEHGHGPGHGH